MIYMIDVVKWWAYVDDLIRDWIYLLCMNPWMLMFDYNLIVNCGLTPSGPLVDHLPYPYGWVDGVQE